MLNKVLTYVVPIYILALIAVIVIPYQVDSVTTLFRPLVEAL